MEKNNFYGKAQLALIQKDIFDKPTRHNSQLNILEQQKSILKIVILQEQRDAPKSKILGSLTQDLQLLLQDLQTNTKSKSLQEVLHIRMHQLAVNKILVFTHGLSDFRLVASHFCLGRCYAQSGCYEQGISHFTIASTKLLKMGDIKQTKIYNSYIFTALARCYYCIQGYTHALELISRAYEIQSSSQVTKNNQLTLQTLQLLALVNIKSKNLKQANKAVDKTIQILNTQTKELNTILQKLKENSQKYSNMDHTNLKTMLSFRSNQYVDFIKPFQNLFQRIDYLIINYDKKHLKHTLYELLQGIQFLNKCFYISEEISYQVKKILIAISHQLKHQKIFKLKIQLQGDKTAIIDQQILHFLDQYDHVDKSVDQGKCLSIDERIQIYKLIANYHSRNQNIQSQLQFLQKLQRIYYNLPVLTQTLKFDFLKVKRNMSMIYSYRKQVKLMQQILTQIKQLEIQIFGQQSQVVKKTINMMKVIFHNNSETNSEIVQKKVKSKLRRVNTKKKTLIF